jgi:nucleotide-binding universal stress UspA family protein
MTTDEALTEAAERPPEADLGCFVVGYDSTAGSKVALQWAAQLAARTGASLRVVACWVRRDVWAQAQREQARGEVPSEAELDAVAERMFGRAVAEVLQGAPEGLRVETVAVHSAEPAEVLVEHSASAGLVFVGAKRRSGFGAGLLGTVSGRLLREAACPVVVVPHRVIAVRTDARPTPA